VLSTLAFEHRSSTVSTNAGLELESIMCKYLVMIYRQTLPVDVTRIPSGVSRHQPYPYQRDPSDCQLGREGQYKMRKGGGAVGPTGNSFHQRARAEKLA
jgi:hypothetical protein